MGDDDEGAFGPMEGGATVHDISDREKVDAEHASIEDRAANGEAQVGEEDDGQMFVWEQGRKVTLSTLYARGTTVEHAFVFGGKRLRGRGGLVAFDEDVVVITRGLVAKTSLVPTRDDEERVIRVTVETHIAPKVVLPLASEEGAAMAQDVIEAFREKHPETAAG